MKTLIQVIEVWTPDAAGQLLESGGGLYGAVPALGAISASMCFGRGEGLPGRAWEAGRPILLKDLQGGYFRRAAAAKAARLSCAVAMPVYLDDQLKAVVVFFCGDNPEAGAIELWRNDPRVTPDMTLSDGFYGSSMAESFASASGDTYLPRGAGLPGLAWQKQSAVFMDELARTPKFVRAEEAAAVGIQRGLAIPCPVPTRENYALAFLSTASMPYALRVESWMPDAGGRSLERAFGFCEAEGKLPAGVAVAAVPCAGTIAAAFTSAAPALWQPADGQPGVAGSRAMAALPIMADGAVSEVLALYI